MSAWPLYRAMSTSVVEAFCCRNPSLNALLHALCLPFVLELVRLGLKMEGMIARDRHLQGACRWLVEIATEGIHIDGAEGIPRAGPLLLVSNHAGLGDAHAALLALPRRDTLLLARDFGILPGLTQFRQYVIVVDEARPYAAIRQSIQHLQSGGSLLLFSAWRDRSGPRAGLGRRSRLLAQLDAQHRLVRAACARAGDRAAGCGWRAFAARAAESVSAAISTRRQAQLPGGDPANDVRLLSRCADLRALWDAAARTPSQPRADAAPDEIAAAAGA